MSKIMKTHLSTQSSINNAIAQLTEIEPNGEYMIEIKKLPKTRTAKQNRALHKYCQMVADELKETYTVQQVLEQTVEREWDMKNVKHLIWRPVQIAISEKQSTADQETLEYIKIHKYVEHFLSSKFGIHVPWPSKEN